MNTKFQIKDLFHTILSFFPLFISIIFNNSNDEIYLNIGEFDMKINDAYKNTFKNINNMFYDYVTLVFSPNDKLVSHLNVKNKDENDAIYCSNFFASHTKQLNLKQIQDFFGTCSKKTIFLFTSYKQMQHYNELRKQNKNVSYDDKILKNIFNKVKKNVITQNYEKVYNLTIKYTKKKYILQKLHTSIETQGCFVKFSYNPFEEDDIYLINSYLIHKITNKNALIYYQKISTIWQIAHEKLFSVKEKIEWVDFVVTSVLEYFLNGNLLKKRISVEKYPEIIPLLFPIQFVEDKHKFFVQNEIVRFCVNLRNIRRFQFYSNYFNKIKIDEIIECVPELYFSEVL